MIIPMTFALTAAQWQAWVAVVGGLATAIVGLLKYFDFRSRRERAAAAGAAFIATVDARTAKQTRLLKRSSRRKSLKIAAGTIRLGPGARTVTLRFSSKAKQRLKRRKLLKLTLIGTVSDQPGNFARTRANVTLRR